MKNNVLPIRLDAECRTATWNPALTRANQVRVRVRESDGTVALRPSVNSGRVRVRVGERIESVEADET